MLRKSFLKFSDSLYANISYSCGILYASYSLQGTISGVVGLVDGTRLSVELSDCRFVLICKIYIVLWLIYIVLVYVRLQFNSSYRTAASKCSC